VPDIEKKSLPARVHTGMCRPTGQDSGRYRLYLETAGEELEVSRQAGRGPGSPVARRAPERSDRDFRSIGEHNPIRIAHPTPSQSVPSTARQRTGPDQTHIELSRPQ